MECWASIFTLTFGKNRAADLLTLIVGPTIAPKKTPWYSFLLEVERTPVLLNADGRNRSLENFQVPYRKSNPQPTVLWRNTPTNCTGCPTWGVAEHNFDLLPWNCQQQPPSKISHL